MDNERLRKHRFRNSLQSLLLLAAMAALLAALGWAIAGVTGMLWALVAGALVAVLTPKASPRLILGLYRARSLQIPQLEAVVCVLAERAALPAVPRLYRIPSAMSNAFTIGSQSNAAIAVTDGMLRQLDAREFIGVLAHEMSHIAHNDTFVMGLADVFSRLTGNLSTLGQLLLVLNIPLLLFSDMALSWKAILVLVFAPGVSGLMQLALSRAREYDADAGAVALTGDPEGLARALRKMERRQGGIFEQILMPGRRVPEPSLLRTHPPTEERVRRLRALSGTRAAPVLPAAQAIDIDFLPEVRRPPRWHVHGLWY